MSSLVREFCLSDDLDGVLRELCKAYEIDASLLSWQFERHALLNGATPFRLDTDDHTSQIVLKDGVTKVSVEVEFSNTNPNDVKYIKFYELPVKKTYLITQTSMAHIRSDSTCPLWIELPKGATKEDIGAVQSLIKADICCHEWADFIPSSPQTALERAFLVFASTDLDWIKKQLVFKDAVTGRLTNALAFKNIEVAALKNEIQNLKEKLDEKLASKKEVEDEKAALRSTIEELKAKARDQEALMDALTPLPATPSKSTPKKRKVATPTSQIRKPAVDHPQTAPAATQGGDHHMHSPETPTKKATISLKGRGFKK